MWAPPLPLPGLHCMLCMILSAGLVTEAPVFSKLTQLPTLLGQFVHTTPLYWWVAGGLTGLGDNTLGVAGGLTGLGAQLFMYTIAGLDTHGVWRQMWSHVIHGVVEGL